MCQLRKLLHYCTCAISDSTGLRRIRDPFDTFPARNAGADTASVTTWHYLELSLNTGQHSFQESHDPRPLSQLQPQSHLQRSPKRVARIARLKSRYPDSYTPAPFPWLPRAPAVPRAAIHRLETANGKWQMAARRDEGSLNFSTPCVDFRQLLSSPRWVRRSAAESAVES